MKNNLSTEHIKSIATKHSVEPSTIYAIYTVESRGKGFLNTGEPVILFERHIFWRMLGKMKMYRIRRRLRNIRPDLCHHLPTKRGGYGSKYSQHKRLDDAANIVKQVLPNADNKLLNQFREAALQSASWGVGQVMGFNYQLCGFDTVQDFINAMYKDEVSQFDAMINFLISNKLFNAMKRKDWNTIARFYNGRNYRKFNYHKRLANADASYQG